MNCLSDVSITISAKGLSAYGGLINLWKNLDCFKVINMGEILRYKN